MVCYLYYLLCCLLLIYSSGVIPKNGGYTYVVYVGGTFDITVQGGVKKAPIVLPQANKTTQFNVRMGDTVRSGIMETINKK